MEGLKTRAVSTALALFSVELITNGVHHMTEKPMTEKHAETTWSDAPFGLVRRLADDVDHLFEEVGLLPERASTRRARRPWRWFPATRWGHTDLTMWTPDVDMFQRGHELVLRIDLPGLKKEDLDVHITDSGVNIRGERHEEHEVDEGTYRRERVFGAVDRYVSLPEGAITEQAKATFQDGVLEIVMPAPPAPATRGRRLEVSSRVDKK